MVKRLLVFFLAVSSFGVYSQKYQPIDSTMVWRDYYNFKNMNSGCAAYCNYEVVNCSFQFHGYEINNGITWLKIYRSEIHSWIPCQSWCTSTNFSAPNSTDQFQGYLWDDTITKKVYYTQTLTANFTPTIDHVFYDYYNKNVGDSLWWRPLGPPGPPGQFKYLITAIDSMLIGAKYHKRYTVHFTPFMPSYPVWVVEGVGSFRGAWTTKFSDFESNSKLVCASKAMNGIYITSYTSCVNTAAGCGTINAVSDIEMPALSIHPNPASTQLSIENIQFENLMVTDIFGKIVLEQNHYSPKISVQHLPTGLYFLRLRCGTGIYSSKFIKE